MEAEGNQLLKRAWEAKWQHVEIAQKESVRIPDGFSRGSEISSESMVSVSCQRHTKGTSWTSQQASPSFPSGHPFCLFGWASEPLHKATEERRC
jgi:hypothetical protein